MNWYILIMIYAAWLVSIILHETGHLGKMRIVRWLPPEGTSLNAQSRWGGLLVTFAIMFIIFTLKPESIFLQILGLFNFMYLLVYLIWGSFNYEPQIPKSLQRFFIIDDIPNELWWIAVPIGIAVFYYFRVYYLNILMQVLGMLL